MFTKRPWEVKFRHDNVAIPNISASKEDELLTESFG